MADGPDLTDRQRELINHLPAAASDLAERMDVSQSSIRDHISSLRDREVRITHDRDAGQYFLPDQPKVRRVSSKHTGTKTKEANEYVTEVERAILRRLKQKEPLRAPQTPTDGSEDMVLHLTDLHIGDVVEDETGTVVYDTERAKQVVAHITEKVISLKDWAPEIDTLHVCYGGDIITNENIYDGQAFDIESMLADQMTDGVHALTQQLKRFSDHFDTVQVICQPGNHGKTRASGVSKQANMDLVCYRWIDDRLREAGIDNIDFTTSEATWYRTFGLRGGKWTGFLTHGQDSLKHVDATGASSRDWRGWLNEYQFDFGLRGHYHESKIENVQNGPLVVESPSPKPSDEWTSRIGYGSVDSHAKRLASVFGVSDSRPMTWHMFIDASGME